MQGVGTSSLVVEAGPIVRRVVGVEGQRADRSPATVVAGEPVIPDPARRLGDGDVQGLQGRDGHRPLGTKFFGVAGLPGPLVLHVVSKVMAGAAGFEPATFGSKDRCSAS